MYALNLDKDTNRELSATYPKHAPADALIVEALPEGNLPDYIYTDGGHVYDPLPQPEPVPSVEEQLRAELEETTAALAVLGVTT